MNSNLGSNLIRKEAVVEYFHEAYRKISNHQTNFHKILMPRSGQKNRHTQSKCREQKLHYNKFAIYVV